MPRRERVIEEPQTLEEKILMIAAELYADQERMEPTKVKFNRDKESAEEPTAK